MGPFKTGTIAIFMVTAVAAASNAQSTPPFTLASPSDGSLGPVVLAIADYGRAFHTGQYYCPEQADGEPGICTGNGINEGPLTIVRYLSARPAGWTNPGRRPLIRYFGQQRRRGEIVGRRIVVLEQTGQGYFWQAYHLESNRGWLCFPAAVVAQLNVETRLGWREWQGLRHCARESQLR